MRKENLLNHFGKSFINQRHRIEFHNSSILATKTRYINSIIKEVIEIELNPYNINGEGDFWLSKSWALLICSLKPLGTCPRFNWLCSHYTILNSVYLNNPYPLPQSYGIPLCSPVIQHFLQYPCQPPASPYRHSCIPFKGFLSHLIFLHNILWLLITVNIVPSSPILVTLMTEEMRPAETSVLTRAIQHNIPE
jgi:hypothetical protein